MCVCVYTYGKYLCMYVYVCMYNIRKYIRMYDTYVYTYVCMYVYIYIYELLTYLRMYCNTYPIVLGVKYFSTFNETLEHFKDV